MTTAFDLAAEAAEFLRKRFGGNHDIVAVLGSGWADAVGVLGTGDRCAIGEVPGFKKPSALGHGGEAISVSVGSSRVLVLTGRTHLYEGHGTAPVVHGVRTAAALGCRVAVLTNGAGVLREDWTIGEPVMISDHINLTGHSPMTGDNPPAPFAGRFVDLTDAYSKRLRAIARGASPMNEGVYLGLHGPHYETPAEIRAGRSWGADLVGMSTVLEVIAARHVGLEVLALSLPTNLAAGISPTPLSGEEVIAVGKRSAARAGEVLRSVLSAIDAAGHAG
ncbi:MAG: purine-nucleoside phosphorylase [Ilumatobacteraceae bacterium]|nr:purine-nucleoside phosphorylase [Acidimicrobiia bacterium]NCX30920.1 purine-nucleoside phosphorylase [Actinomycetota bacterium]NCX60391.1 purine-nucleoside phosphorylase [Actinomycetota bacterium]NDA01177.1 purine-nucleoside phosphorylase [Acidimicrobiia bacterium]NDC11199.1 purine-nucleoside phosphorylase [Actinomycetota bacterium]